MDSHTYGSMVEHGGYATGGNVTVTWNPTFDFAGLMRQMVQQGQIRLTTARDPDDGAAGVPAKV